MEPDSNKIIEVIPELAAQVDVLVVDGPAGLSDPIRICMLISDRVLVPAQPAGADLASALTAARQISQARSIRGDKPSGAIFLNRVVARTRLLQAAISEVAKLESRTESIKQLKTCITQRQAVADCYGNATSVFEASTGPALEAADEYKRLFTELLSHE